MNTEDTDFRAPQAAARQRPGALRAVLAAAAAALLLALGLSTAPAALAHDSMIGSTPKNGETVTEPLDSVELNFSGELKSIGAEVRLADAQGNEHDAETATSRNVLTVDFGEALPAGEYTLTWRAVSSDGHPIEGTSDNNDALTFTVEDGQGEASTPASSAAAESPAAATEGTTTAASSAPAARGTSATQAPDEQSSATGGLPTVLIWVIIAVAVIGAAVAVFAKVRRQSGSGK